MRGRQEILELYLQDKPLDDDIDVKAIARGTPGFNGAGVVFLLEKHFSHLNIIFVLK